MTPAKERWYLFIDFVRSHIVSIDVWDSSARLHIGPFPSIINVRIGWKGVPSLSVRGRSGDNR